MIDLPKNKQYYAVPSTYLGWDAEKNHADTFILIQRKQFLSAKSINMRNNFIL